MTKTLLVTGGLGFIGSNFILYILQKYADYRVINLDAMTYAGRLENVAEASASPRYMFIQGDITDPAAVEKAMSLGIDAVVHFAAESHVDRSISAPLDFSHTNIVGTHHLLESARKHRIQKFIHISTDEVYGTLGPEGLFTESTPISPNSPYSASKAGSDLMARAYYHTFGLPVSITRCSNNYGPRQHPEKLIPLTILRALHDQPIPVYGSGTNIRDWLYVEDHCTAIDAVLHKGRAGEVYNIGGSNEWKNIDVVRTILQTLGKSEQLIEYVRDRPGHDFRYAIDASKCMSELGWKPMHYFAGGIKDTVEWYIEHEDWWRPLWNRASSNP
jgi:dTDP-glucose 4,6-dehydratase